MSGMKLIGSETKRAANNIESCYDELSYSEKEMIGFPYRYYDLSVEQKFFVDSMFESCYNMITNKVEVQEELENLRSLSEELQNSANTFYNLARG